MNLYLVRHADAVPIGGEIRSDFDRTLSERGRADALLMAKTLAQIDIDVKAVLTSPLVRAVQTGEIFGKALLREAEPTRLLEPGFDVRALADELMSNTNGAGIVAIGHQPDMSMFISYLVSPAHAAAVAMETCAIACIAIPPSGVSQLRWLLTPETVRRSSLY